MAGVFRKLFNRGGNAAAQAAQAVTKSVPLPQLMVRQGGGQPEWRDWSTSNAYREGYLRSTWLYDAVELRRKAVASVPWRVEVRDREGNWEHSPDHPLQLLLDNPNPDFTPRQMIGRLVQWLDLGGNAYWLKVRDGRGVVGELWPVMPDSMTVIPSGQGRMVDRYRFENGNVKRDLKRDDVTHFAFPNPASLYYGVAPVQAAGMAVDVDTEAQSFQKVSLQNRGVPDGVFTMNGEGITRDQWEQARQQVREQYQGQDAHRAPWVVAHAQWEQMSLSPVDLDYINSRKESRIEILSALGVPPPMVQIYENATLNNIETARHIFWLDTVVPLLEELRDALQSALVPEFGDGVTLRVVYDTSGVAALRENYNEQVEAAQKLWQMGVPLNTINQRVGLGLEGLAGGDTGYISASLLPATGAAVSGDGDTDGESQEEADEDQTLSESAVQTILTMIQQIARGELPRQSAIELISGAFNLSDEDAQAIVGDVVEGSAADSPNDEDADEPEERAVTVNEVKDAARARMRARGIGTTDDLARLAYGV